MFDSYLPQSELVSFGPITIHWYGLFIVLSLVLGSFILIKLSDHYGLNKQKNLDALFWIIINGIIGARIYHILLEWGFYSEYPWQAIKIWEGGLAIHGAIIAGLLTAFYYSKKLNINFWQFTALLLPGLALGQALGRWGNYFNQEVYGRPTDLPWGIPIEPGNRLSGFSDFEYFHPTFLYESIGNLAIFAIMILLHYKTGRIKNPFFKKYKFVVLVSAYLTLYSVLRFATETLRIDPTPVFFNIRLPQIVSSVLIFASLGLLFYLKTKEQKSLAKK